MYRDKIYNLYLRKAKLTFKDEFGTPIDPESEIGDFATPLIHGDNTTPDFYIRGFFRKVDHNLCNEFIIANEGPHIIFFTGVNRDCPTLDPYRFKDTLFSSYYEDTVKGCLFQVLKKQELYISLNKHNSLQI